MKLVVMMPLLQLKNDYVSDICTNFVHLVREFNYNPSMGIKWEIINCVCRCWEYKYL